jgi:hypothetical protein
MACVSVMGKLQIKLLAKISNLLLLVIQPPSQLMNLAINVEVAFQIFKAQTANQISNPESKFKK